MPKIYVVILIKNQIFMQKLHQIKCILWTVLSLSVSSLLQAQCKQPIAFSILDKSLNSATVKWSDQNSQDDAFEIELIEQGQPRQQIPNLPVHLSTEITLSSLKASTTYELYVRAVCSESSKSKWTGPVIFTTHLTNPTICGTNLTIRDNGEDQFIVDVTDQGTIGQNIFIESIDFIIDHNWPADLKLTLESPSGHRVVLSAHNGVNSDHFGDPTDLSCNKVTRIIPEGCKRLKDDKPPFIGSYAPDNDMSQFAIGTPSQGTWKLITTDRAAKDIGKIKYFAIRFSDQRCLPPTDFTLKQVDATEVAIDWIPIGGCSNAIVSIIHPSGDTTMTFYNCNEPNALVKTIRNLLPNTEYQIYIAAQCIGTNGNIIISPPSCQQTFITSCAKITTSENFDNLALCESSCNVSCPLQSPLLLQTGSRDWIIYSSETPTPGTGPNDDVSIGGRYIYLESDPSICDVSEQAVLQTRCMDFVGSGTGCDLSFHYHMSGTDIGTLFLEISTDNGVSWQILWSASGDQGSEWKKVVLSLSSFYQRTGAMRFRAASGQGVLGDIALDEIQFMGAIPLLGGYTYYRDVDNDGYGVAADFVTLCSSTAPNGYVVRSGDCNDEVDSINPGEEEVRCNGRDENCNGQEDDLATFNPIIAAVTKKNESCAGSKDGNITLAISGGKSPYTVRWSDGLTGNSRTALGSGIYYASVTDADGCIRSTDFIDIKAESTINLLETVIKPNCTGQANGKITIQHSVSQAPYTYLWSTGKSTQSIDSLLDGTYAVTVTDGRGCTSRKENIILTGKPTVLVDTRILQKPSCSYKQDGAIDLITVGGIAPYLYLWENGATTKSLTQLNSGIYTCVVRDANDCKNTITIDLKAPDTLKIDILGSENVTCFGNANGSVRTHVRGGTPPYTYFWDSNLPRVDDLFNLPAGSYNMTVTDNNACTAILPKTLSITQPDEFIIKVDSIAAATCIKGDNGYASLIGSGGTPPYSYVWSHTDSISSIFDDLVVDKYSITAFDLLGCKADIPIVEIPYVNLDIVNQLKTLTENICYKDEKAAIGLSIDNGTPPYDINWSNGTQYFINQVTDTLQQLPAGIYSVTITDSQGCTGMSSSITFSEKTPYFYQVSNLKSNTCPDDTDGAISLIVSGGSGALIYKWEPPINNTATISNLPNGLYICKIKDQNDCLLETQAIPVSSASNGDITADIVAPSQGLQNGKICLGTTGMIAPISVQWSTGASNVTCIDNLVQDIYNVSITDAANCQYTRSWNLGIVHTDEQSPLKTTIYPNPTDSQITVEIQSDENFDLKLSDNLGKLIYQTKNSRVSIINVRDLQSGVYTLHILDKKGQVVGIKRVIKI
jgi:subtilisin-like proprotein convertase family protein